jgi:diguanylate cyclase (GGDEF)-like protein
MDKGNKQGEEGLRMIELAKNGWQVAKKLNGFFIADIASAVVAELPPLFQIAYTAVFLYEMEGETLECLQHSHETPLADRIPSKANDNLFGYGINNDKILSFASLSAYQDEIGINFTPFSCYAYLKNHCLILPLIVGYQSCKELVGVLVLADRKKQTPFSDMEKTCAGELADIIAYRIAYARLWESARKPGKTDAVNGVFGWHPFYESLGREMYRSVRYRADLSLIVLGIDKYQEIGAQYGAAAQNYVSREAAMLIHQGLRTLDIVSRKGDCFFIALPETKQNDSLLVAERLRKFFANHAFKHKEHAINVTISIGLTSYAYRDSPVSLLNKAELSLAHARERGGNQISIYEIMQEAHKSEEDSDHK